MVNQTNKIYQEGIFLYNDSKLSQLLDDLQLKAWCTKRNTINQFVVHLRNDESDTKVIVEAVSERKCQCCTENGIDKTYGLS